MPDSEQPSDQTSEQPPEQQSEQPAVEEVTIDAQMLKQVHGRIVAALQQGVPRGMLHLPQRERHVLMVATDLIQKSGQFPQYRFTFYHQGKGEGTDTCAITFIRDAAPSP
jgi:hypothetical protein